MTTINDFAHHDIADVAELRRAIKFDAIIGEVVAECDVAAHNNAIKMHRRQVLDDAFNLSVQLAQKVIVDVVPSDNGIILYLRDDENKFYRLSPFGVLTRIYFNDEQDPDFDTEKYRVDDELF